METDSIHYTSTQAWSAVFSAIDSEQTLVLIL